MNEQRTEEQNSAGLRAQVANQCRVVAHMANAIARVHEQLALVYAGGHMDRLLEMKGADTAALMEYLGNLMNDMDIVTEEDKWVDPIFDASQKRWPQERAT